LKISENKPKEAYALKYIRKIDCVRADFAHNIIRERRILQELEHPLIVNLRYAFQDEEFMYMVSDLMYPSFCLDGRLIVGWEEIYDFISIGRRFLKKRFGFGLLKWLVR
jgi:serine/threonine protein kinase